MHILRRLLLAALVSPAFLGVGGAAAASRPHITLWGIPAHISDDPGLRMHWTPNFTPVRALCMLDEREVACGQRLIVAGLATGPHVVQVMAWSGDGRLAVARTHWKTDLVAPPVPTVSGAPDGWVTGPVTITAGGSTDVGTSIAHYEYVLSSSPHLTWYGRTVTIAAEGTTTVAFQTIDRAGNASGWSAPQAVRIDRTPPAVTLQDRPPGPPWLTGPVTVSATATDSLAGVAQVEFETSSDCMTWSQPQPGAAAVISSEGINCVRFRATDDAGNVSAWSETGAMVDSTPPTLTTPYGAGGWTRGPVLVVVYASDAFSGLRSVQYETSTDGGQTWSDPQPGNEADIAQPGITEVRFQATDWAGNSTPWTTPTAQTTALIDQTPPTVSPNGGGLTWSGSPVAITAGATDAGGSGIFLVQHETSSDGGITWSDSQWGDTVVIGDHGTTLVRFRAFDNALNCGSWSTPDAGSTAVVDQVPPRVTVSAPVGFWANAPVTASATATDAGSGVAGLEYETSFGLATWSAPHPGASVVITNDGGTYVRFRATDNLGNTSDWQLTSVMLDSTPPVMTTPYGAGTWVRGPAGVVVYAHDALSGNAVVTYETSTDGGQTWSEPQPGNEAWTSQEGSTEVRFQATDRAGNSTPWTTPTLQTTAMVDTIPPAVGLSESGSGSSALVTATVTDSEAGVSSVDYELSYDGGATWSGYHWSTTTPPIDPATTLVRFQATDKAGNTSAWVSP